ncbi:MAG: hypothetical protein J6Q73_07765 [Bacteroidaceae bacterium]|nr:hypothetical protein [Bacteroidaceae bacterium]
MALRKFFVVLECDSDEQHDATQKVFNELSNARFLTAGKLLQAYPVYKAREVELKQLFSIVSANGVRGLMSVQGASLLAKLARR